MIRKKKKRKKRGPMSEEIKQKIKAAHQARVANKLKQEKKEKKISKRPLDIRDQLADYLGLNP